LSFGTGDAVTKEGGNQAEDGEDEAALIKQKKKGEKIDTMEEKWDQDWPEVSLISMSLK
jgi:hypothetical protein